MKKNNITLLLNILLLSSASCSFDNSSTAQSSSLESEISSTEKSEEVKQDIYKRRSEESLVPDSCFKNGFQLMSPKTTDAHVEGIIDYNGLAEKDYYIENSEYTNYWQMCQWWTPYDFIEANYSYDKASNTHKYENESRLLEVNIETGSLRMRLDAYKEYQNLYSGPRPSSSSWSHFLIQSSFPEECKISPSSLSLDNGDGINFQMDITINEATYKGEGEPIGNSCCQLLMYVLLTNQTSEGQSEEEYGRNGDAMWFGLPIYDSRYKTVAAYKQSDVGFEGATNKLIWSLPSNLYMPKEGIEFGKTYHIDFNVLEYLTDAFTYGIGKGFLQNCKWQNMKITYMNFGWEIPGEYVVDSTLENLDIKITHNNEI